jgi:hypothetical protein
MRPTIVWDLEDDEEGNYWHIVVEGHGVTQEEVDEVMLNNHNEATTSRETGSPLCFGWTSTGKYLGIPFEAVCDDPLMLRPLTAFLPPIPREKRGRRGNK